MISAFALVLALSLPIQAPDLQVEASTSAGTPLPELADAVARALVASGARVVLRSPTSAPCAYCAKVTIVETVQGDCRLDVSQDKHTASATLHLSRSSPLFDRARAIAIQARLLVNWDTTPEPAHNKESAPHVVEHKSERKPASERAARATTPPPDATETKPPERAAEATPPAIVTAPVPVTPAPLAPLPVPTSPAPAETLPPAAPVFAEPKAAPAAPAPAAQVKSVEPAPAPAPEAAVAKRLPAVPLAQKSRWPWIPTITGSAAAIGAGICALVARDRYNALSDKSQSYLTAQSIKTEGEHWQLASFIFSGVAVAGITTGLLGFGLRSSSKAAVSAWAAPVPGGGAILVAGELP